MDFLQQGFLGKQNWWRYLISHTVLLFPFLMNILLVLLVPELLDQAYEIMKNDDVNKNSMLTQNLIPFVILLALTLFFVRYVHERSVNSVLTARKKMDWKRFFFGVGVWGFFTVAMLLVGYFVAPDMYVWNFKSKAFFTLVLVAFALIPLQTSFEEIYFRGYLMQSLGVLTKNRWIPFVFTSVLFGLMHAFNPEVKEVGNLILIYYISTGFLFGMVTLLDEGLELALGMHAINNILAAILVTTDWVVFQTDALFIDMSEPDLGLLMFVPVFIIYPLVVFILSKKYGWKNWNQKLFGKVNPPQIES